MKYLLQLVRHPQADLYFLLGAALVLVAVELWNEDWTTALFAGVLGAFAISLLRLRGQLPTSAAGVASVFMDGTPPDLPAEFAKAREVVLIGVSLDRTIRNSVAQLEDCLRAGGDVRVLVVNPACETALAIADRRAYLEHGVEQRRQHVLFTLDSLRKIVASTGRGITVKVTNDPLTFGATMIDGRGDTRHSRIVIQHYSYKKQAAREPNPVFVLRPADGKWFADFREEIEGLWQDGSDFDLAGVGGDQAQAGG